jgi:plastocyanin
MDVLLQLVLTATATLAPQGPEQGAKQGAEQGAESDAVQLMRELGRSVRIAESALESDDAQAAAAAGGVIARLAPRIPELVSAPPENRADVAAHVARLQRAAELAAPEDDPAVLRDRLQAVRTTCTSCHLELRPLRDGRAPWPNEGGAVRGRVRLFAQNGAPRANADHVVVFLEDLRESSVPPGPKAKIAQRGKTFVPDLLVVRVGTEVEFPNEDAVFHNVFSKAVAQPFDLGTFAQGESRSVTFTQAGLVKVYCNIHPEMVAHVLVLPTQYSSICAPSGFFALTDVADGRYRLRTWSEFGGGVEREIEVANGAVISADLEMRETVHRLPHLNKHGLPYREKY